MKYRYWILIVLFFIAAVGYAQKSDRGFKLQEPHRDNKRQKLGFVGTNPASRTKSRSFIKSGKGVSNEKQARASRNKNIREQKKTKLGYVGDNPSLMPKKVKYMKPEPGKSPRSLATVQPENRIKKPKRKTDFIAADKTPQNQNLRIPKQVTDKQMVLPKMRGDKRANKATKLAYKGADPGVNINSKKEKKVSDIQYRSSYKFDKQGTDKKKFFRKNKKD